MPAVFAMPLVAYPLNGRRIAVFQYVGFDLVTDDDLIHVRFAPTRTPSRLSPIILMAASLAPRWLKCRPPFRRILGATGRRHLKASAVEDITELRSAYRHLLLH
jgi:hypothetical protein